MFVHRKIIVIYRRVLVNLATNATVCGYHQILSDVRANKLAREENHVDRLPINYIVQG